MRDMACFIICGVIRIPRAIGILETGFGLGFSVWLGLLALPLNLAWGFGTGETGSKSWQPRMSREGLETITTRNSTFLPQMRA